jgi:hypothetical protein
MFPIIGSRFLNVFAKYRMRCRLCRTALAERGFGALLCRCDFGRVFDRQFWGGFGLDFGLRFWGSSDSGFACISVFPVFGVLAGTRFWSILGTVLDRISRASKNPSIDSAVPKIRGPALNPAQTELQIDLKPAPLNQDRQFEESQNKLLEVLYNIENMILKNGELAALAYGSLKELYDI